jgi:hypothetical protein
MKTGGSSGSTPGASGAGLLNVPTTCGPIGATHDITATSGPNGKIDWLDCGINDDGGWRPPHVNVSEVIAVDLSTSLNSPNSPFKPCKPYISLFNKHAGENNIPAIMLASFAMQESTCNPNAVGGGGEQGLMQLSQDKCGDAPNGNCQDPNYNIATAAKFFKSTLDSVGGNLVAAVGDYNGWQPKITFAQATAAAKSKCCRCQNNLDYVHQMFNGWMQGINPDSHDPPLGKYFNLKVCGNS